MFYTEKKGDNLPRKNREYSISNVYHIIFRGNDKQDIFYEENDRYKFLEVLKIVKTNFKLEIYSYCLMSNHIHIVIRVKDLFLSKAMHSLGIRYSMYFNKKYRRTGHLFEGRFFSKRIENLNYLLSVCKYVHRNPEKADIQKTEMYKWSSYRDYINQNKDIVKYNIILYYYNNNLENFRKFTLENDDKDLLWNFADFELKKNLDEEEVNDLIKKKYDLDNASDISLMGKNEKEKIMKELKKIEGTNLSQLSRVIKVSKYYLKKSWN